MMGYGFGLLGMWLPLIILGLLIYWAVRSGMNGMTTNGGRSYPRPIEVAEERYARGEINFSELEEIRQNLRKK